MKIIRFYDWLIDQQERDDLIADFAKDAKSVNNASTVPDS